MQKNYITLKKNNTTKNIKKVVIFFQSQSYYIIGQSGKIANGWACKNSSDSAKFDMLRKKWYNKDVVSKGGTKNIWRKQKKQKTQYEK